MRRMKTMILAIGILAFVQVGQADWTPAKRLTWTTARSLLPRIAADSFGFLHIVWIEWTAALPEIYYKKSTDGGATWGTSKRLTWTSGSSLGPTLAVDPSGHLHAVWDDSTPGNEEVYYKKSTDGGDTWSTAKRLTSTSGNSSEASLVADPSGHLHVAWYDSTPGNEEVYYKKSTDGGNTWSTAKRLTWNSGSSRRPVLAVDPSGHLHVVWYDSTPGNWQVYYKKSTNEGSTWTESKRLTWSSGFASDPALAIDPSGHLHVVWYDSAPGHFEIYYKMSTDEGASWAASKRLTWTSDDSLWPVIGVDSSGYLHVVWQDLTPGNYEVYYKKSTDGGATWTTSQRLTWTSGASWFPTMASDSSDYVHVVWYDDTSGSEEIYYKKGK